MLEFAWLWAFAFAISLVMVYLTVGAWLACLIMPAHLSEVETAYCMLLWPVAGLLALIVAGLWCGMAAFAWFWCLGMREAEER